MSFTNFKLDQKIVENIAAIGFSEPTPIQERAIPVVMSGRDVIGLAQTGTGKTAAFALPLIHKLMNSESKAGPRGLIIAPTRELADQIDEAFGDLSRGTGLKRVALYGGVSMGPQLKALKRGVDVIIACPGRLLDHIRREAFDASGIEMVVFDEADRMFDMGFLADIRKIIKAVPRKRQTLLFTATMPREVRKLCAEFTHAAETVKVGETGVATTVSHSVYTVPVAQKRNLLLELVGDFGRGSAIVFTRTKRRAKALGDFLKKSGVSAASLQGDLSQNRRRGAIKGFRVGKYQILVATDIAARGIDVSQVSHVVNFDMPDTVEAYTHRTGRTGRALKLGDALSFATPSDKPMVSRIKKQLKITIGELPLPESFDEVEASMQISEEEPRRPQKKRHPRRRDNNDRSRGGRNKQASSRGNRGPRNQRKQEQASAGSRPQAARGKSVEDSARRAEDKHGSKKETESRGKRRRRVRNARSRRSPSSVQTSQGQGRFRKARTRGQRRGSKRSASAEA